MLARSKRSIYIPPPPYSVMRMKKEGKKTEINEKVLNVKKTLPMQDINPSLYRVRKRSFIGSERPVTAVPDGNPAPMAS